MTISKEANWLSSNLQVLCFLEGHHSSAYGLLHLPVRSIMLRCASWPDRAWPDAECAEGLCAGRAQ